MQWVELVAVLAIIQFLAFGAMTGGARRSSGLKAPAMSGHPEFERMYRVQTNTLELLVAFLPALFLSARYWPPGVVAGVGGVYLIGRVVYWRAYVVDPSRRGPGFMLSLIPIAILCALALVGVVLSLVDV